MLKRVLKGQSGRTLIGAALGLAVLLGAALTAAAVITNASAHNSGSDVSFTDYGCNNDGLVTGTIHFPAGSDTFVVYLTDHVPGESKFYPLLDIGAYEEITPGTHQTSADFTLDPAGVRSNANTMRIETTLSNAKSLSFKPCGESSPTATPTKTKTSVPTATKTAQATHTAQVTKTAEVTKTVQSTKTAEVTKTVEVTQTREATSTHTAVPTNTNTPVPTNTNTPVPTNTNTPVPTNTNTPMPTNTNTPVPTNTNTPVPTNTNTPVPTNTNTPVPTEPHVVPTDEHAGADGDQHRRADGDEHAGADGDQHRRADADEHRRADGDQHRSADDDEGRPHGHAGAHEHRRRHEDDDQHATGRHRHLDAHVVDRRSGRRACHAGAPEHRRRRAQRYERARTARAAHRDSALWRRRSGARPEAQDQPVAPPGLDASSRDAAFTGGVSVCVTVTPRSRTMPPRDSGAQQEEWMIAIVAKLTVQEGKEEEFKAAGAEMVAAVKQNEAGRTLQYTLAQSQKTPTEFYFIEAYADADAAQDHGKTPHMAAFGGKIGGLLAGRPEITRLNTVATVD